MEVNVHMNGILIILTAFWTFNYLLSDWMLIENFCFTVPQTLKSLLTRHVMIRLIHDLIQFMIRLEKKNGEAMA